MFPSSTALLVILLFLAQPLSFPAGGSAEIADVSAGPSDSCNDPAIDRAPASEVAGGPQRDTPVTASSSNPKPIPPEQPCPEFVSGCGGDKEPAVNPDLSSEQSGRHRGVLALGAPASGADPRAASGPDTPPPASGDWTIGQPGNRIDNGTIVLNGDLLVTAGDLALDNVTLVLNCTADGQYEINVSRGAALKLTNTIITSFNGSLHYKFSVFGALAMDRCDACEMWGDPARYREGGGLALHTSEATISSSRIFNGSGSGLQVHGNAALAVTGTEIFGNRHDGIIVLDSAAPRFERLNISDNRGNGLVVLDTATPAVSDCTASENNMSGIAVFDNSKANFRNCTSTGNSWNGAGIYDSSGPEFQDCNCSRNSLRGIVIDNSSHPSITNTSASFNLVCGLDMSNESFAELVNCTADGNNLIGVHIMDAARPNVTRCTAVANRIAGFSIENASSPNITGCTASGNKGHGYR